MPLEYESFITHDIDMFMGKPKSGKTLIAGSAPKPMLYIGVGNDGGGRVLAHKYAKEVAAGDLKVINLRNDMPVGGKIAKTSCDKLAEILRELRKPDADQFKTIVIDTVGGLQDDYCAYIELTKGKRLSTEDWGEVQKIMINLKDNMKRFSEEKGVKIIWTFHTREYEVYETSGLAKEIRILPMVTVSTGNKFLKDASNVFYCCRKTTIDANKNRIVKFLTYVGPHPLMDTGTRDITYLPVGGFVENFDYQKWQSMIDNQSLNCEEVITPEVSGDNENTNKNEEE